MPVKSSAPCANSARQYADGPPLTMTSGTAQTAQPASKRGARLREHGGRCDVRCRSTTSTSSGSVSHATCERMPAASAARKLAAMMPPSLDAASTNAWTAIDAASPGTSLSGRAAVSQYNGHVTVESAATTATSAATPGRSA